MDAYYRTLGLSNGASLDEVRKAYRRLAKQHHPDMNPGEGSRERFLEIVEAYEVLMGERNPQPKRAPVDHDAIRRRAREEAMRKARMRYAEFLRQQEKEQGEAYGRALIWVVVGAAAILTFLALRGPFNAWRIAVNPYQTSCRVTSFGYREATIRYEVDGAPYTATVALRRSFLETLSGNGMPIRSNHTFALRCRRDDPTLFEVMWEYPGRETVQAYLRATAVRLPEAFPEWGLNDDQATCMAVETLEEQGIDGLAVLFFFDESALENYRHNALVFSSRYGDASPETTFPDCF